MKIREAIVGLFTAIASALASVALAKRALKDDRTETVASTAAPSAQAATEPRKPAGFLPKKERDTEEEKRRASAQAKAQDEHPVKKPIPPGWSEPEPKEIPRPTYWPVVMSVGITFIFWGIVTSLLISGLGLILFGVSLAGWIGDIRNENAHD